MTVLAFPAFNLSALAFVALVPLFAAFTEPWARPPGAPPPGVREGARLGFWYGFVFFFGLLYWIPLLPPENVTVPFLMYPALVVGASYLGLYLALWGGVTALALGRGRLPLVAAAPAAWMLVEAVRASGPLGFPWGSLGYSQWAALPFIQIASVGGLWLVSGLVVAVNALAFQVVRSGARPLTRGLAAAGALALVLIPSLWGSGEIRRLRAAEAPERDVLLIQPNTGNDKWEPAERAAVIGGLQVTTREVVASAPPGALVIWPETATPTLLLHDPAHYGQIQEMVTGIGRPLLTGFPDRNTYAGGRLDYWNAAGLFLPGRGVVGTYHKIRLVPFAEYLPVPGLNRVNFGQGNFTPGDSLVVFRDAGPPFSVLICIEAAFPDLARRMAQAGARYLVNITNDQWFGRSAAPWQHFSMAVFRAVENRMGIARAANTGVTGFVDPDGSLRQLTGLFVPATVSGRVRLGGKPAFYTRHGDWILLVAGAVLLAGVVRGLTRPGGAHGG